MTLITAVEGKNFVVLASDGKGSREDFAGNRVDNINAEKLISLTKYSCALIANDSEIGVQLIEEFKSQYTNIDNWGISKVVKEFSKFCKKEISHISDSVSINDDGFPQVIFIVAGMDRSGRSYKTKINVLKSTKLFFPGREKDKSAKGKPLIAYYILDKKYNKDLNQNDMCFLVGEVMSETARIDGDVGGRIRMAIIDERGFRSFSDDAVDAFTKNKIESVTEQETKELEKIVKE